MPLPKTGAIDLNAVAAELSIASKSLLYAAYTARSGTMPNYKYYTPDDPYSDYNGRVSLYDFRGYSNIKTDTTAPTTPMNPYISGTYSNGTGDWGMNFYVQCAGASTDADGIPFGKWVVSYNGENFTDRNCDIDIYDYSNGRSLHKNRVKGISYRCLYTACDYQGNWSAFNNNANAMQGGAGNISTIYSQGKNGPNPPTSPYISNRVGGTFYINWTNGLQTDYQGITDGYAPYAFILHSYKANGGYQSAFAPFGSNSHTEAMTSNPFVISKPLKTGTHYFRIYSMDTYFVASSGYAEISVVI